MNIHDQLKISKCGYSKITDHVCREIRHKRINRNQGINLIKHYEQKNFQYSELFSEWLGVDTNSLNFILERSKNPQFWKEVDVNKFIFSGPSNFFKSDEQINSHNFLSKDFISTDTVELNQKSKGYVYFGKGF